MKQHVVCGDVFEKIGTLEENSAHCSIVDYPWEFTIQTSTGDGEPRRLPGQGDGVGDRDLTRDDAMFGMESDERLSSLLKELSRVLTDGSWVIFMSDDRFQDVVRNAIRSSDFILRRNWAWTPESMGMGTYGRVDHYPIPVATLGETNKYVTDRPTLFRVPGGRQTDYPTGKPVELYRQILRPPVIEDGEKLLEPFCGSAPGAEIASERGLNYWGCDVNENAVQTALDRFNQSRLQFF